MYCITQNTYSGKLSGNIWKVFFCEIYRTGCYNAIFEMCIRLVLNWMIMRPKTGVSVTRLISQAQGVIHGFLDSMNQTVHIDGMGQWGQSDVHVHGHVKVKDWVTLPVSRAGSVIMKISVQLAVNFSQLIIWKRVQRMSKILLIVVHQATGLSLKWNFAKESSQACCLHYSIWRFYGVFDKLPWLHRSKHVLFWPEASH